MKFNLEDVIKKETRGDHQKGLLAFVRCIRSRPQFFAEQLQKAMKVKKSETLILLKEKIINSSPIFFI